ncbi:hypothetical protein Dsin_027105 [Dipteronia sinensis]|uniref:Uncharacterized protein n=1 Tax=Dipteronia sinensis TaxID=43782 RepID=A0AAE0DYG4_9ROSI|nr:hypothetical protein Dsin_027105 [Dipteronia sinensis]
MGILSRTGTTNITQQEGLPVTDNNGSSSPLPKRKWSNWMPIFVTLVVILEIAFLGRLDMAKNAAMIDSLVDIFHKPLPSSGVNFFGRADDKGIEKIESGPVLDGETCEVWLEREDSVVFSRDFEKDPIMVSGAEKEWQTCSVGCKFGYDPDKKPDAAFGMPHETGTASVLRSMESAQYYSENNIAQARRWKGISDCDDYQSFFRCSCWIFFLGRV